MNNDGMWRVDSVIDGLYEVRDVITSGGMGVVHRMHHRGWNVDMAVKTPRPELVSSPQRIADFEIEAQTWVELGLHPNIVACVYVRRLDGLPRGFAEWIDGGSLADAINIATATTARNPCYRASSGPSAPLLAVWGQGFESR